MVPRHEIIAAEYQHAYINHIKEGDVNKALKKNTREFKKFLKKIPRKARSITPMPKANGRSGKCSSISWMRKGYLLTGRSVLPGKTADSASGFDENAWAANAGAAKRKWNDLVEEFKALQRKSTEHLFGSFTDEQLRATGTANGQACQCAGPRLSACRSCRTSYADHQRKILVKRNITGSLPVIGEPSRFEHPPDVFVIPNSGPGRLFVIDQVLLCDHIVQHIHRFAKPDIGPQALQPLLEPQGLVLISVIFIGVFR